ncbi:putative signal transducing protein [Pseudomonas mucidolens]|uniref:putative signal transducing protein n=1 Tax=Pseudomonas mucidolens TaxID=46679 RepID=UPI0030D8A048
MQRIYEPENLMEGELLQQMLASEGIEAHLVGRHLLGGTGELPIFGLLGLEVENDQASCARELVTAYIGAQPMPGDDPDNVPDVLVC